MVYRWLRWAEITTLQVWEQPGWVWTVKWCKKYHTNDRKLWFGNLYTLLIGCWQIMSKLKPTMVQQQTGIRKIKPPSQRSNHSHCSLPLWGCLNYEDSCPLDLGVGMTSHGREMEKPAFNLEPLVRKWSLSQLCQFCTWLNTLQPLWMVPTKHLLFKQSHRNIIRFTPIYR